VLLLRQQRLRADARVSTGDCWAAAVRAVPRVLVPVVGMRGMRMRSHVATPSGCVRPVAGVAVMAVTGVTQVAVMRMTRVPVGATRMAAVGAVVAGISGGAAVSVRLVGPLRGPFVGRLRGRRSSRLLQGATDRERPTDLSGLRGCAMQVRVLLLLRVLWVQLQPGGHAKHAALACGDCPSAAAHVVRRAVSALRPTPRQQPLLVQWDVCERVGGARARATAPVAPAAAGVGPAVGGGVEPIAVQVMAPVCAVHAPRHAVRSRRHAWARGISGRGPRRFVRLLMLMVGVLMRV